MRDVQTGRSVLIAARWGEDDLRAAVAQIIRLAGVPPSASDCFLEEVAEVDAAEKAN